MECLFCEITKNLNNSKTIYEDDKVGVIMDINPTCEGHLLIIPKTHYDTVFDVPAKELEYMFMIGKKMTDLLEKKLGYKGMTLEFNYGERQLIKHAHMHVIGTSNAENQRSIDEIYNILKED